MANYPNSKDDLTEQLGGDDPLNNPSHSQTHNETNEAVNAIQSYVGFVGDETTGTLTGDLYVTTETANENTSNIGKIDKEVTEISTDIEAINNLIFSGTEGEEPLVVTGGHNQPGLQMWLGTNAEYQSLQAIGYDDKTLYVVV